MAVKPSKSKAKLRPEEETPKAMTAVETGVLAGEESGLDPQEEKILDWILKGVVAFILGWLGLSILMVIGGYFGIWK
jgi:hypothetical protein